jgi:hypothetical protein
MDADELLGAFVEQEKFYNFEGSRGIERLLKIVQTLDPHYRNLEDFFSDNPGAIEAIVDWIEEQVPKAESWEQNLRKATS